jgi:zinc transporter 9
VLPSTPGSFPTPTIALLLLTGFTLMLIIEQYLAPYSPPGISPSNSQESYQIFSETEEHMDYNMQPTGVEGAPPPSLPVEVNMQKTEIAGHPVIMYPLILGLVIHSLADGLALGALAAREDNSDMSLSLVVFLALIIHKCLRICSPPYAND